MTKESSYYLATLLSIQYTTATTTTTHKTNVVTLLFILIIIIISSRDKHGVVVHDIRLVALPPTPLTIVMKGKQCLHSLNCHPLIKKEL